MSIAIKSRLGIAMLVGATVVFFGCGGDPFEGATGLDSGSDAGIDAPVDAVHDATVDKDDPEDVVSSDTSQDTSQDTIHDTSQETSPDATDDVIVVENLELTPLDSTFSVEQGETSAPVTFTVKNAGNATTGPVQVEVLHPAFAVAQACGPLDPGTDCAFTVTFEPAAKGVVTSPLLVSATPGGSVSAALMGHTPVLSTGELVIDPPVFDFGAVDHGGSEIQPFTIRNEGSATLSGLTFEVKPAASEVFKLVGHACPEALAPSQECSVDVQYRPLASEPGRKNAELYAHATGAEASAFLLGNTPDVFVRPSGNDNADGLSNQSAVKTIGKGLERAQPDWTVRVEGAKYAAEAFPLRVNDVRLLGVTAQGMRPSIETNASPKNLVVMEGANPVLQNLDVRANADATVPDSTVVIGRPTTKATLQDVAIHMNDHWTGIGTDVTDSVPFDILSSRVMCSNTSAETVGIAVYGSAGVFLDKSEVAGCDIAMTIDGNTSVKVRESLLLESKRFAVSVTSASAQVDMGKHSVEAGGNTFIGDVPSFVALNVTAAVTVDASGNVWVPLKQGASSSGQYVAGSEQNGPLHPTVTSGPNNLWLQLGDSVVKF